MKLSDRVPVDYREAVANLRTRIDRGNVSNCIERPRSVSCHLALCQEARARPRRTPFVADKSAFAQRPCVRSRKRPVRPVKRGISVSSSSTGHARGRWKRSAKNASPIDRCRRFRVEQAVAFVPLGFVSRVSCAAECRFVSFRRCWREEKKKKRRKEGRKRSARESAWIKGKTSREISVVSLVKSGLISRGSCFPFSDAEQRGRSRFSTLLTFVRQLWGDAINWNSQDRNGQPAFARRNFPTYAATSLLLEFYLPQNSRKTWRRAKTTFTLSNYSWDDQVVQPKIEEWAISGWTAASRFNLVDTVFTRTVRNKLR